MGVAAQHHPNPMNTMLSFLARFAALVRGVLSGFDRLFFCGSLRRLSHCRGLQHYLWEHRIPYKDFAAHSLEVTARLEEASLRLARQHGREIRYLNSAQHRKEDIAREIAARDRIKEGLICVLRSVDPCMSFQIHKNHRTHKLEIQYRQRKCLHLYHYQIHPIFGFMHTRIQTWFPFRVYVCLNGREWLARQMDQAGLRYVRRDNTFTWLEDLDQRRPCSTSSAGQLAAVVGRLRLAANPAQSEILPRFPCHYYWSVSDSEWASDVLFPSPEALATVYPRLLRYAITTFTPVDVMRFLGQPVPASGKVPHACRHEISSNIKERREGVRIKHWLNGNSLKMYDKGSVLRVETLIRDPGDFKVYRPLEGDPQGPKEWRPCARGSATCRVGPRSARRPTSRYLGAADRSPGHDTAAATGRAVVPAGPRVRLPPPQPSRPTDRVRRRGRRVGRVRRADLPPSKGSALGRWFHAGRGFRAGIGGRRDRAGIGGRRGRVGIGGRRGRVGVGGRRGRRPPSAKGGGVGPRRVRALNPLAAGDAALLEAVSRHEFLLNGLRNRDLRGFLYRGARVSAAEQRRQSAAVTRQLRLLRAHGLIRKVPKTHRYVVSEAGRRTITALLAARNASVDQLTRSVG